MPDYVELTDRDIPVWVSQQLKQKKNLRFSLWSLINDYFGEMRVQCEQAVESEWEVTDILVSVFARLDTYIEEVVRPKGEQSVVTIGDHLRQSVRCSCFIYNRRRKTPKANFSLYDRKCKGWLVDARVHREIEDDDVIILERIANTVAARDQVALCKNAKLM